jgi:hypothetical protein
VLFAWIELAPCAAPSAFCKCGFCEKGAFVSTGFVNVPSGWFTIRLAEGACGDNLFLFNGTEVLIGLIYDGAACCLFDGGTLVLTLMAREVAGGGWRPSQATPWSFRAIIRSRVMAFVSRLRKAQESEAPLGTRRLTRHKAGQHRES